MDLHILFMQRKERFEGQFGPEALVCWDEYTRDENPDGFGEACDKAIQAHKGEAAGFALLRVAVNGTEIRKRCLGTHPPLMGKIIDEPGSQDGPDWAPPATRSGNWQAATCGRIDCAWPTLSGNTLCLGHLIETSELEGIEVPDKAYQLWKRVREQFGAHAMVNGPALPMTSEDYNDA